MRHAEKTHCKSGHSLSGENLVLQTWRGKTQRRCRTCHAKRNRVVVKEVVVIKKVLVKSLGDKALRDRIDELEEENRQLRKLLLPEIGFNALGLTNSERSLLAVLYARPGSIFNRERFAELINYERELKNFDVFMSRIRRKLPDEITIRTIHGYGWTMDREAAAKLKPYE